MSNDEAKATLVLTGADLTRVLLSMDDKIQQVDVAIGNAPKLEFLVEYRARLVDTRNKVHAAWMIAHGIPGEGGVM